MWSSFYAEGGWGMYAISVFGFCLLVASVLYGLRPQPRHQRLLVPLGVLTISAGLLGTAIGISTSARYLPRVEPTKQLEIFALGIQESLHNAVLSLIFGGQSAVAGYEGWLEA